MFIYCLSPATFHPLILDSCFVVVVGFVGRRLTTEPIFIAFRFVFLLHNTIMQCAARIVESYHGRKQNAVASMICVKLINRMERIEFRARVETVIIAMNCVCCVLGDNALIMQFSPSRNIKKKTNKKKCCVSFACCS